MSSDSKKASTEEARKLLDDRVLVLEKEILDIKHQRNQLAPITQLPVEVLAQVFLECAQTPWQASTTGYHGFIDIHMPGCTKWTVVSHVCQRWREVALGCSELWSVLNPRTPEKWLEAMIERSRDNPLSIVDPGLPYILQPEKREVILKALSEPGRWKRVELRGTSAAEDVVKLISHLTSPAPSLTELILNLEGAAHGLTPRVLPWEFLGGEVPCLRSLEISHCHPCWNPEFFTNNLTSLKLTNPPTRKTPYQDTSSGPSPQGLADVLTRIPLLTQLDLEMKLPDMSTISQTFEFAHLQRLRLAGEGGELAGLLGCLRISSALHVEINCAEADELALLSLGCALEKAWATKPATDSLSLWRLPMGGSRMEGTATSSPGTTRFVVSMGRMSSWSQTWEWPSFPKPCRLLGVVYWDHVETLSVQLSFGVGDEKSMEWVAVFERMRRLKTLSLFGEPAREFLKALMHHTAPPAKTGSTNRKDTLPLPYLESLTISGANILLTNKDESKYGPCTQTIIVALRDLVQWIQQRLASGAPKLKQLVFKECGGFSPKVEELVQKLQKAGVAKTVKQEECAAEVQDLDAESDSDDDDDEDSDDYYEGYGYHDNPYLSDDGVCNGCLEFGCEGECGTFG